MKLFILFGTVNLGKVKLDNFSALKCNYETNLISAESTTFSKYEKKTLITVTFNRQLVGKVFNRNCVCMFRLRKTNGF